MILLSINMMEKPRY